MPHGGSGVIGTVHGRFVSKAPLRDGKDGDRGACHSRDGVYHSVRGYDGLRGAGDAGLVKGIFA